MRRADVLFWRTLIFAIAKIPLAIGLALFPFTQGRLGLFMALSLAYVGSSLIEAFYLVPRILPGYRPRPQLAMGQVRPLVRFSLGNYSADSIGAAGSLLLPVLILDILGTTGAENVAYFYIASVLAGMLAIIPWAIFTSFYAEASQKNANRHADERRAILLSTALLIPGIIVLLVFSKEILTWFGNPAYATGSAGTLHILVLGSIPIFLNNILMTRVRIRKKSAPLIMASTITTAVTLVLGVLLLRTNGIDGLALATVLGTTAAMPYWYMVARQSFREEPVPPIEPSQQL
jgi:O-antigen/teichoic acid export membrane protein